MLTYADAAAEAKLQYDPLCEVALWVQNYTDFQYFQGFLLTLVYGFAGMLVLGYLIAWSIPELIRMIQIPLADDMQLYNTYALVKGQ